MTYRVPHIEINGRVLSTSEVQTLRAYTDMFIASLPERRPADTKPEVGQMFRTYRRHAKEILRLIDALD